MGRGDGIRDGAGRDGMGVVPRPMTTVCWVAFRDGLYRRSRVPALAGVAGPARTSHLAYRAVRVHACVCMHVLGYRERFLSDAGRFGTRTG